MYLPTSGQNLGVPFQKGGAALPLRRRRPSDRRTSPRDYFGLAPGSSDRRVSRQRRGNLAPAGISAFLVGIPAALSAGARAQVAPAPGSPVPAGAVGEFNGPSDDCVPDRCASLISTRR
jgi:hypothetical protein